MIDKNTNTFVFSGWFGFWMFMTVFLLCDAYFYSQGNESMFWRYKPVEEKIVKSGPTI
jgi:heme/copper-type cytochrome/quinol oxidase subunit 1